LERRVLGHPQRTLLSTNASCQPEKLENSQVKPWGSASTQGLSAHPRTTSLPTGEDARRARTRGMLRIRASGTVGAAVNKTGVTSWGRKVVAPLRGRLPNLPEEPQYGREACLGATGRAADQRIESLSGRLNDTRTTPRRGSRRALHGSY